MRWDSSEPAPRVQPGDTRYKEGFLIFPKCIEGEWRWLEKACWIEEAYEGIMAIPDSKHFQTVIRWRGVEWTNV